MKIPEFLREIIWSFYPPRYRQLADKHFHKSLRYMSKILLIVFLITAILFIPKLATLRGTVESELSKFQTFKLEGNVSQSSTITIPVHNPWVVVDLNNDYTLTKEFLVIDKTTIQYRFLTVKKIQRDQLKDVSSNRASVSGFFTSLILLLAPGIALVLYIRLWLKYLLLILVFGTFFFIVMELTHYRLRWKQMLSIAAHAITPVIAIEVVSSFVTTAYLLPVFRFLGVSIYAITTILFAFLMTIAVVGYHIEDNRKK